jgi:nucleoside 2-deoxyribosyltransferase
MKIYVAASFNSRDRIRDEIEELEEIGHVITGVWFQEEDPIEKLWDGNFGGRVAEVMALRDFNAIERAEVMIIDTLDPSTSGGRNVELGWALAKGKRIILVGPPTTIFFALIRETYDTWEEFWDECELGE